MDDRILWAIVGIAIGFFGGLATAASNIYQAKRSTPYGRIRMKADLEILEKVRALGLDDTKITARLQTDINKRYEKGGANGGSSRAA
jgi:hypothetical protein